MKLLFVDSCVSQRGADSRTAALCRAFLDRWREKHPDAAIKTVRPAELALRPFDPEMLNRRDSLFRAGRLEEPVFDLARQFRDADQILVGAPFWDLTFPASLRIYIEYVCANGVTYHYDADGPHGDCRAARLAYLTSGGDFERPESLGVLYWKQLCGMFGIQQFDYVFAGGLDAAPEQAAEILEEGCRKARALAETF